ncbi:hypothetical protein ACFL1G_08860 [Planctomycetota bacterium]
MLAVEKKDASGKTALKKHLWDKSYRDCHSKSSVKREEKIAERQMQIPRAYRAIYDRAVQGKSLRAAVNSFCIGCTGYQREEVRLCTSLACPLYAVRPYQSSQNGLEGAFITTESKKSEQGVQE